MNRKTPQYNTMLFCEVWNEYDDFKADLEASPFKDKVSDDSDEMTFYLLYSRYGNNPIANCDVNQFKYKCFSLIWMYGPTWEKRLKIQDALRALQLDDPDLFKGTMQIHNHALNPETAPSTRDTEELDYVNEQNVSKVERGKLDAYGMLWNMLDTDVTEEYIMRFKKLFKIFVRPENPLIYITEEEEEEEDD